MTYRQIQYIPVDSGWIDRLDDFFKMIKTIKADQYFHPHPFDRSQAEKIGNYKGQDLYFLQINDNDIYGYGMLRGWDEGFCVPSLGIIIHPDHRNQNLGEQFMIFLHEQARRKGSKQIRLRVYPSNTAAIALYKKMGYGFSDMKSEQLTGYARL